MSSTLSEMFARQHSHPNKFIFTFVNPTKSRKISYKEQQELLRITLEDSERFKDGLILDTLEKGVHYPVIHVAKAPIEATCRSKAFLAIGGKDVELFVESEEDEDEVDDQPNLELMDTGALGPDVHVQQGVFTELKRIEPDYASSKRDNLEKRAYIMLGITHIHPKWAAHLLEQLWRDWTGARSIYFKLRNEHDMGRIIFFRRTAPTNDYTFFNYIVLVECWNINATNELQMLDFVQRIRVEHISTYISVYRDLDAGLDGGGAGRSKFVVVGEGEDWGQSSDTKQRRGHQVARNWVKHLDVQIPSNAGKREACR